MIEGCEGCHRTDGCHYADCSKGNRTMKEYAVCNVNTGIVDRSFDTEAEARKHADTNPDALLVMHRSQVDRAGFRSHDDFINANT